MYIDSFNKLKYYCEAQHFAGWDPYDGLNSKVFQATPLKNWGLARLAWIQGFKRSPINFRKLLFVPKEHNAKGVALFLNGYCNIYTAQQISGKEEFGTQEEILEKINYLAKLLISLQSKGYSGACWGYNFDWQNRVFYQPKSTPTVVATSFCADALFTAYDITLNKSFLETALSSCNFILKDLKRSYLNENEFIFSYSPLDTSRVYNASLLGARLLAKAFTYTKNNDFKTIAINAAQTIVNKQNSDGSWIYGEAKVQSWIDSYHTGYNLECIYEVMKYLNIDDFDHSFSIGIVYYINNFFNENGAPKYYNNQLYPIDIHSTAQLLATLCRTNRFKENADLVNKTLTWTIKNMQSAKGYFYYQLKQGFSSKIPYMRWAQAWMFYGFSEFFKSIGYENMD